MKIGYAMKSEEYSNFPLFLQIIELQNCGCEKVYIEEDFIDGSITELGLKEMGVERKNIKEIHTTSKDILMYMPSPEECPPAYVKEMMKVAKELTAIANS